MTHDTIEFLDDCDEAERHCYRAVRKAIWGDAHLNPREENRWKPYFVENSINLKKLVELLDEDPNTGRVKFFSDKLIVLLGNKGTGKSITQNFWLHTHNEALEKRRIFWIRLDANKWYKYAMLLALKSIFFGNCYMFFVNVSKKFHIYHRIWN